jgi:phenylpyruvate tautomerase PptA (4-oxalocrotonate tautomerase family)
MPTIIIKAPEGVFDAAAREEIAAGVTAAAKAVEQIGDDPRHEFTTWVVIEEIKRGFLFAGGRDPLSSVIPVLVSFHHPEGVIDQAGREEAVRLVQEAIAAAAPADGRPVITSVVMSKVADGTWGAAGTIWRLADFARAAGFRHLQHLVQEAAA